MDLASFYILFHDPIWVVLLSITLFFPVRQLIWVLYVRRKQKEQKEVSDEEKKSLKKTLFNLMILLLMIKTLNLTQTKSM